MQKLINFNHNMYLTKSGNHKHDKREIFMYSHERLTFSKADNTVSGM